ncbi:hypothetical protein BON22_0663 [Cyberlindnera fabianii]|uniref:Uncharacterized protein n=1 Tax=Cyberlindnera fabianii TaxID=36022 RepID=A0A1V2LDZ1_CYBFA|nr:hypothetical protein BON22_0663 [Cyberlindnera fabianii]
MSVFGHSHRHRHTQSQQIGHLNDFEVNPQGDQRDQRVQGDQGDLGELGRGFRSSRHNRHEFKQRSREDYTDEYDDAHGFHGLHGLHGTTIVSAFKSFCRSLDLTFDLRSFEHDQGTNKDARVPPRPTGRGQAKKVKRRRLNFTEDSNDHDAGDDADDNAEQPRQLNIKLRNVESKVKFQRELIQRPLSHVTDPLFPQFTKSVIPARNQISEIKKKVISHKYKLRPPSDEALSKKTATSLLKARFTSSGSGSGAMSGAALAQNANKISTNAPGAAQHAPRACQVDRMQPTRTISPISLQPILLKRLGI